MDYRHPLCTFLIIFVLFTITSCGSGGGGGGGSAANSSSSGSVSLSVPILSIESSFDSPNKGHYGQTRSVLKSGNYVYVADGNTGLIVLLVTKFNTLSRIAALPLAGSGRAVSLAMKGNYIYMAARDEGVYVIDVSNPPTPVLTNKLAPGSLINSGDQSEIDNAKVTFLKQVDDLLYVSAGVYFVILDITVPGSPVGMGMIKLSSINQHFVIENNMAYIAGYYKGLRIIDLSFPATPTLVIEKYGGRTYQGIAKLNNYIYMGGGGSGLLVIDISDRNSPTLANQISLQDEGEKSPYSMSVWKNFLFVADGLQGIKIVDISTPVSPVLLDTFDTPGDCHDLVVDDSKLYVADFFEGVHLINIFETSDIDGDGVADGADSFPSDPLEWLDTDGDNIGNNADTDDDNDTILDSSDDFPTNPLEWLDTDGDGFGDNTDVFILDPSEWEDSDLDGIGDNADTIDVPELINLSPVSSYTSFGQARGTLKDDNYIYVANGTSGLTVLEIATNGSLSEIGSYTLNSGGRARYLAKINQYLYMAARSEGLIVLDVSDPANPQHVYTYDTPDMATFLTLDGTTLYLSDRNSLQIFDVSIPQTPIWLSELTKHALEPKVTLSEFEHVIVHEDIAYIAGYYHGLIIVDVSDPASPSIISRKLSSLAPSGHALWAVEKYGNYVFTGGEGSGLIVYDIRDPYNPEEKTVLPLPSSSIVLTTLDDPPFHMKALGTYLFIADGENNIQIVNISDPLSPFIANEFSAPGNTQDFSVYGYTLIIGNYTDGIRLINLGSNVDHDSDGIPNFLDSSPLVP